MTKNKHIGSTLDSLFEELGEADDVGLFTQKKLLAAKRCTLNQDSQR